MTLRSTRCSTPTIRQLVVGWPAKRVARNHASRREPQRPRSRSTRVGTVSPGCSALVPAACHGRTDSRSTCGAGATFGTPPPPAITSLDLGNVPSADAVSWLLGVARTRVEGLEDAGRDETQRPPPERSPGERRSWVSGVPGSMSRSCAMRSCCSCCTGSGRVST